MSLLYERAKKLADIIKKSKNVHIVTHIDADGIAAGAIALESLKRQGIEYSIECARQLDEQVLSNLIDKNYDLVWFTDLGSGISNQYPEIKKVITDHHSCPNESDFNFHLNPHLFQLDGTFEISGAGTTYLVSKSLNKNNVDLSPLSIIGACGDLQDKRYCKLVGENRNIMKDGKDGNYIKNIMDIRYFGRETRPVAKLLQYASDPNIPGLSGREDACTSFLQDLTIRSKDNEYLRKWIDLDKSERRKIISSIAQLFLQKGFGYKIASRIIGEIYILPKEAEGTELHDAKEFATLLNSTARYGQHEVGLQVCLGDRDKNLKKALNLLRGHRQNLVAGLQFAREEKIEKRKYIQFFHAGEGIRDTIIGIVTNMMLHSEEVDSSLPLFGFAIKENGDVKVSARTTQELVDKGLNLSYIMKNATKKIDGFGGGHSIAAGATIPKGKEEEFLEIVEKEIKNQLGL